MAKPPPELVEQVADGAAKTPGKEWANIDALRGKGSPSGRFAPPWSPTLHNLPPASRDPTFTAKMAKVAEALRRGGYVAPAAPFNPFAHDIPAWAAPNFKPSLETIRRLFRNDRMTPDDLRAFDHLRNDEIVISDLDTLARTTIGNVFDELGDPTQTWTAPEINTRLADALRLGHTLDTLDDMRHDFDLLNRDSRISDLENMFREQIRRHAIRYGGSEGRRNEPLLKNMFQRLMETIQEIRSLEATLRGVIREYDPHAEWLGRTERYSELLDAGFDAMLRLEMEIEEKLFEDVAA